MRKRKPPGASFSDTVCATQLSHFQEVNGNPAKEVGGHFEKDVLQ